MEVVKLLQDPDLSYTEIAERTNTSFNLVDQVFTGSSWKHLYEGIEFPLRNSTSFKRKLDTDQIKDIISRILNGDCDSEIAKDYNVDSQTIQNIRLHKSHKELTQDIDFGKYCYKGCKLTKP